MSESCKTKKAQSARWMIFLYMGPIRKSMTSVWGLHSVVYRRQASPLMRMQVLKDFHQIPGQHHRQWEHTCWPNKDKSNFRLSPPESVKNLLTVISRDGQPPSWENYTTFHDISEPWRQMLQKDNVLVVGRTPSRMPSRKWRKLSPLQKYALAMTQTNLR